MTTPTHTRPRRALPRRFPIWAVALIAVTVLVLAGVAWALAAGLGSSSAESAVTEACRTAVRGQLGAAATDVDLEKYPPLVTRPSGSNRDGTFQVAGEVDFTRAGVPARSYYDCKVRRSEGGAAVVSISVV